MSDSLYFIEIEHRLPSWDSDKPGVFRTFYAPPLIDGVHSEFEQLTVDTIFGRRLTSEAMQNLNESARHPNGFNGSNEDWRNPAGLP